MNQSQYSIVQAQKQYLRTAVHTSFRLKSILVSGAETSGRRGVKGLIRSRKRTV